MIRNEPKDIILTKDNTGGGMGASKNNGSICNISVQGRVMWKMMSQLYPLFLPVR